MPELDFLFEVSWEICHKIGGIHTVISSKLPAQNQQLAPNKHLFIGPDVWKNPGNNPDFREDRHLLRAWREQALSEGLRIKIGHWQLPEKPIAVLVDFTPFFNQKDDIFTYLWDKYGVDSINGDWDYIEPALFGYAAALVIESFAKHQLSNYSHIAAHFHEWMTGAGVLCLRDNAPHIASIFTAHATVLGRALSSAQQPIYQQLDQYEPEITAHQYGIKAKHSLERAAALHSHCFTAVSELCASECKYFLDKQPDLITPNGFEPQLDESELPSKSQIARKKLLQAAQVVTQTDIAPDAILIATAGRYEYHNKGYDLFIKSLQKIAQDSDKQKEIVAYFLVPAPHTTPRIALNDAVSKTNNANAISGSWACTHHLQNPDDDFILQGFAQHQLLNQRNSRVKVVFVPTYLNGDDGVFNCDYYELLSGFDLSVFPSAYDPWGYTPLESLSLHVPTITSSLTGFGQWITAKLGKLDSGLIIIDRNSNTHNDTNASDELAEIIDTYAYLNHEEKKYWRETAQSIARIALWENLIALYEQAHQIALRKANDALPDHKKTNMGYYPPNPSPIDVNSTPIGGSSFPSTFKRLLVQSNLPNRLQALAKIANNLWWSWTSDAMQLFKYINPESWNELEQNPIALLDHLDTDDYERLLQDADFMDRLDKLNSQFDKYMQAIEKRPTKAPRIAYFCMEYGMHRSVKLYSGGLGVLAGDYLKEASDCNVDMIAIGLLYRYGYFTQNLSPNGEQIAQYDPQRFSYMPIQPVKDANGNWVKIGIALPGRTLYAKIWRLDVGRVPLYLLDSEITENNEYDRSITHRLYGGDNEMRLLQEILLGIGGTRLLQTLAIERDLYHLNEGHAAFAGLERLAHQVQDEQLSFDEALEVVRVSSIYTTHTPVPAGHDAFSEEQMRTYFSTYDEKLGITWADLMNLGREHANKPNEKFSMSNFAVRLSQGINGVSAIHGDISRQMFAPLFQGYHSDEVPVGHVTNGVHYPTWVAKRMHDFYVQQLGKQFITDQSNKKHWAKIYDAPDKDLYAIHQSLKRELLAQIRERLRHDLTRRLYNPRIMLSMLNGFNENTLLIGFARRFATYKRATLLFHDTDRLLKLVNHPERPVRFVFAGKAHPADKGGQDLIKSIVELSLQPEFLGKILFIENYDMELARYLVQGVDVWLNNPTRPQEASGTSGMKAALNGIPNLSVLDGWWAEGYVQGGGWALPEQNSYDHADFQNELDAQTIYSLIENDLAPLYYDRNADGIPTGWVQCMKTCIAEIAPQFTMKRQLDDYIKQYYSVQHQNTLKVTANNQQIARQLAAWKQHIRREWHTLEVVSMNVYDSTNRPLALGEAFTASINLRHALNQDDIAVEAVFLSKENNEENYEIAHVQPLLLTKSKGNTYTYACQFPFEWAGVYDYGFRIIPKHPHLNIAQEMALVKWI
jgi:phosphorylase/glycogen(starch) synthase